MRVSIYPNDPGFSNQSIHHKILLDGVEVRRCHTADEEKGFVSVYKVGMDGHLLISEDGITVEEETLYGKVEIKGN